MELHEFSGQAPPELRQRLALFEAQFSCGLGGGRSFHFTYPQGYGQYLASLGESRCVVLEKDGEIVGVIGGAVLRLRGPAGNEGPVVFCEEVKLVPAVRRTRALWPLLERFQQWMLSQSEITISVVLDETEIKPSDYTGRAGIVPLRSVSKLVVLRIPAGFDWSRPPDEKFFAPDAWAVECHRRLVAGRYAVLSDGAEQRSVAPPVWFVHPHGTACGRLEDRRRVRQVTVDDGSELRPMFFGSFAFSDARDALELIREAVQHSARVGGTALRLALPLVDYQELLRVTDQDPGTLSIPAAVYASGVTVNAPWSLSGLEV